MALISKTIGTGGDYSTIQNWYDTDVPPNLTTDGNARQGQCFNQEFVAGASARVLTISGNITNATNYIMLTTYTGASFRDNANVQTNALRYNASNGAGLRSTNAYFEVVKTNSVANCIFSNLQFQQTTSGGGLIAALNCPGASSIIEDCILDAFTAPLVTGGSGIIVRNMLAINRGTGSNGVTGSQSSTFVNCTIIRPSNVTAAGTGFNWVHVAPKLVNCAVFGFSNFGTGTVGAGSSNNCSDVSITGGSANQASKTYANQFQNSSSSTLDLRLKLGADCIDNGATDTTDLPAGDDIAKTVRPSGSAWDIGCWEYVFDVLFGQVWM